LLVLGGCALDEGHIVNVSPSAEGQREVIEDAVERMNELAGETIYWVRSADDSDRRNGEIIVRQDSGVRVTEDGEIVHGKTRRTAKGVIIWIPPKLSVRGFAHELGHAGGLEHVGDKRNLMYKRALPGEWTLTEDQLEDVR
jgi:hypothetical protein